MTAQGGAASASQHWPARKKWARRRAFRADSRQPRTAGATRTVWKRDNSTNLAKCDHGGPTIQEVGVGLGPLLCSSSSRRLSGHEASPAGRSLARLTSLSPVGLAHSTGAPTSRAFFGFVGPPQSCRACRLVAVLRSCCLAALLSCCLAVSPLACRPSGQCCYLTWSGSRSLQDELATAPHMLLMFWCLTECRRCSKWRQRMSRTIKRAGQREPAERPSAPARGLSRPVRHLAPERPPRPPSAPPGRARAHSRAGKARSRRARRAVEPARPAPRPRARPAFGRSTFYRLPQLSAPVGRIGAANSSRTSPLMLRPPRAVSLCGRP